MEICTALRTFAAHKSKRLDAFVTCRLVHIFNLAIADILLVIFVVVLSHL
jgi:hypothetical protein